MSEERTGLSLPRIYKLTVVFGVAGVLTYLYFRGGREAAAFALGALCSGGNLWLFDRLSAGIAPGAAARKPWEAGTYIIRYVILLGIGYGIVKTLNVSPLAVVLGLLSNAAAVLASIIFELLDQVLGRRISH